MIADRYKPYQERVGRVIGITLFLLFTLRQMLPQSLGGMFPGSGSEPLMLLRWLLVTILFVLFLHAYIVRTPARELASRPAEILLPLICAPLPLLIIMLYQLSYSYAPLQQHIAETAWLNTIFALWYQSTEQAETISTLGLIVMAGGELITIAGMLTLRGSFSIFSEVREFKSSGLYRYLRHPLYSGEIISIWGYAIIAPDYFTFSGALLFTLLQVARARIEERKLEKHHPHYALYRQQTGFLLPRLRLCGGYAEEERQQHQ